MLRDGEGRQRIVDLGERDGARAIGRQPSTDIPLSWDTEVSRVHAVLEAIGDEWVLVDDGLSRNGSFVNGERIHGRHRLRDGDVIRVGGSLLAYAGDERRRADRHRADAAARAAAAVGGTAAGAGWRCAARSPPARSPLRPRTARSPTSWWSASTR